MISMALKEAAQCIGAKLIGRDGTFTGCSIDSRCIDPGNLFVALKGRYHDGNAFVAAAGEAGASAAMVEQRPESKELPLLLVDNVRSAMGRLAANWRNRFTIPLIAVTGSNGKTTVKEMVTAVLSSKAPVAATQGNLNNDIGLPLTLFRMDGEHRYAVVELGANHPGEISVLSRMARPSVAVITLCAPAHLEGFGSIDGVANAKAEIFEGLVSDGIAIINADDAFADLWRDKSAGFGQITFGFNPSAQVRAESIATSPQTAVCTFKLCTPEGRVDISLALSGRHNVANALAAASCCLAVGISLNEIKSGLESVRPVKGRLQHRPGFNDARILDDTYNANPASLRAALDVLIKMPGRHWLVLGDMGELGPTASALHAEMGEAARSLGIERLFALGDLSREAVSAFGAGARHFEDVDRLCSELRAALGPDVTVLVKGSRAMALERVIQKITQGT